MPTCFISYARADDEAFAERLCDHLRGRGVEVWWDRVAMRSRGVTFLQEIDDAVRGVDRVVLVCGPVALTSTYVAHELAVAAETCRVVVPVIRLGSRANVVPPELAKHHQFDLSADDPRQLEQLTRTLTGPADPIAAIDYPHVAPLPVPLLDRGEIGLLEDRVLLHVRQAASTARPKPLTVVSGMSGIGKSVLAGRLSRSCRLRRSFPEGVLFLRVGQEATPRSVVNELRSRLGDAPGAEGTLDDPERELAVRLRRGRHLVILDDVWHEDQLQPLVRAVEGTPSQVVATSRMNDLGAGVGGARHAVALPSSEEARRLLLQAVLADEERRAPEFAHQADEIVRRCGRLPLALAICAAHLRRGISWDHLRDGLEAADAKLLEFELQPYEHPGVFAAMRVGLTVLEDRDPELAGRYRSLALFSTSEVTPLPVVFRLWRLVSDAERREAHLQLAELQSRSLLTFAAGDRDGWVVLHDLQRAFLVAAGARPGELASGLLVHYGASLEALQSAALRDDWFRDHLAELLVTAGRFASLDELMTGEDERAENRWYGVRATAGELDGHQSDLDRWERACVQRGDPALAGQLARGTLIRASIASTARTTPPALAVAAVRHGLWRPSRAMATTRRLPPGAGRAQAMIAMLEIVPAAGREGWIRTLLPDIEDSPARDQPKAFGQLLGRLNPGEAGWAVDECLRILAELPPEQRLTDHFAALARHLTDEQRARAWSQASGGHADDALAALTTGLPAHKAEGEVLDLLAGADIWQRAEILSVSAAPDRPGLLAEVARLIDEIVGAELSRAGVVDTGALELLLPFAGPSSLARLLRAFPGDRLHQVLWISPFEVYQQLAALARSGIAVNEIAQYARQIGPVIGAGLLADLAALRQPRDPLLLAEVEQRLLALLATGDDRWVPDIAASLAPILPALTHACRVALLDAAQARVSKWANADGLAALVPALPVQARRPMVDKALDTLRHTPSGNNVAGALAALTPLLDRAQVERAVRIGAAARDNGFERTAFKLLVDCLAEEDRNAAVAWLFEVSASHLTDPAQFAGDEREAVELVEDCAQGGHLDDLFPAAERLLASVQTPALRAQGQAALASRGAVRNWGPVDEFIDHLSQAPAHEQVTDAAAMVRYASGDRRARLIAIALAGLERPDDDYPVYEAQALAALAGDVEVSQRVRRLVERVKESRLDGLLKWLAPLLDTESAAIYIAYSEDLQNNIGLLAGRLVELDDLDGAISLASSPWRTAEVYERIAPQLPLDEARRALAEHAWDPHVWMPDARLAARLAELGRVDESLSVLATFQPGEPRYRATAIIGAHLADGPQRLAAVAKDLGLIPWPTAFWSALRESTPLLARLPASDLLPLYRATLGLVGTRIREQALPAVYYTVPIIAALGGADALRETLHAVMDVCRWWPSYPIEQDGTSPRTSAPPAPLPPEH